MVSSISSLLEEAAYLARRPIVDGSETVLSSMGVVEVEDPLWLVLRGVLRSSGLEPVRTCSGW